MASGEGLIPPNGVVGEEVNIDFDEVQLPQETLGQHDASEGGLMAGQKVNTARISSVCRKIEWGSFEGQPACLIGMEIYFHSGDHILKNGSYELEIVTTPSVPASSASVVHFRPEDFEGKPSLKTITQNLEFAPDIGVAGAQVSLGSASRESSYTKERMWSITGSPLADEDEDVDEPLWRGVEWKMQENTVQKAGVRHHLRVAVLVRHHLQPFVIETRARGKTGSWGEKAKWRLKKKEPKPILRVFHPAQDASKIMRIEDLSDFVAVVLE